MPGRFSPTRAGLIHRGVVYWPEHGMTTFRASRHGRVHQSTAGGLRRTCSPADTSSGAGFEADGLACSVDGIALANALCHIHRMPRPRGQGWKFSILSEIA